MIISNCDKSFFFALFNELLIIVKRNFDKRSLLFKNKYKGITEYISKKTNSEGREVMLLFNKNLSVSPLTTHLPINKISKRLKKINILQKTQIINMFFKKIFKKKPNIIILGL